MADDPAIAAYYARGEEQGRLADLSRLEFLRTRVLLSRFLPPPPASVIDVGGGPGAYALPLAAEGYEVHLVDPMPLHVEQATEASAAQADAPLASISLGDARELPFGDGCADAVLMLGPLYHLTDARERDRALREALRVLRPDGLLAAAAIMRFASTLDGIAQGFLLEPGFEEIVERNLADGQHRNPERVPQPHRAHVARWSGEGSEVRIVVPGGARRWRDSAPHGPHRRVPSGAARRPSDRSPCSARAPT